MTGVRSVSQAAGWSVGGPARRAAVADSRAACALRSLALRSYTKFNRYFYTYHFSIYIYTPCICIDSVVKCLIVVSFDFL